MAETVSNDNRSSALQERHANLERQIEEESIRPAPDEAKLKRLKFRKLCIKDQLAGHLDAPSLKRAA